MITEQIKIANRIIDRVKDEDGVYWYPLKSFFIRILCKKEMTISYRDSNLSKYMKVFEYKPFNAHNVVKAWCMNETGIKYILRRITVGRSKDEELTELRKKNLSEACLYFGIDRTQELAPNYVSQPPNLKDYDIWSKICVRYDLDIDMFTLWRRCTVCNRYYPYNKYYFKRHKNNKMTTECLRCAGKDIQCRNTVVQSIYDNGGLKLLTALHQHSDDEVIVNELISFINRGGYITNDDKCS